MKPYWKQYWISVLISLAGVAIPWCMAALGILTTVRVEERYAAIYGTAALVIAMLYVFFRVKSCKARFIILLLNPVLYYLIGHAILYALFSAESWDGFYLMLFSI